MFILLYLVVFAILVAVFRQKAHCALPLLLYANTLFLRQGVDRFSDVYHVAPGCFSAAWMFGGSKRVARYPYYFRIIVFALIEWTGMFFLVGLVCFGCGGSKRIARYPYYFYVSVLRQPKKVQVHRMLLSCIGSFSIFVDVLRQRAHCVLTLLLYAYSLLPGGGICRFLDVYHFVPSCFSILAVLRQQARCAIPLLRYANTLLLSEWVDRFSEVYHWASGCFSDSWLIGGRKRVAFYPYYFRIIVSALREWIGMFFWSAWFILDVSAVGGAFARYPYFTLLLSLGLKEKVMPMLSFASGCFSIFAAVLLQQAHCAIPLLLYANTLLLRQGVDRFSEVYHFAPGCFSSRLFGGRKRVAIYPYYFRIIVFALRAWIGRFFWLGWLVFAVVAVVSALRDALIILRYCFALD